MFLRLASPHPASLSSPLTLSLPTPPPAQHSPHSLLTLSSHSSHSPHALLPHALLTLSSRSPHALLIRCVTFNTAYYEDGLWVTDRWLIAKRCNYPHARAHTRAIAACGASNTLLAFVAQLLAWVLLARRQTPYKLHTPFTLPPPARSDLSGWFWIDGPSSVPVELLELVLEGQNANQLKGLRILRLFRLIRLLRLLKIDQYINKIEEMWCARHAAAIRAPRCGYTSNTLRYPWVLMGRLRGRSTTAQSLPLTVCSPPSAHHRLLTSHPLACPLRVCFAGTLISAPCSSSPSSPSCSSSPISLGASGTISSTCSSRQVRSRNSTSSGRSNTRA